MSDSNDSDGDFVLGEKSKKKSAMIYSDPEVWESDQEIDTPLKNKSKKSKKMIESESENDSNTESDAMSDDASEIDEDFSSPKKSRKSSRKIKSDSEENDDSDEDAKPTGSKSLRSKKSKTSESKSKQSGSKSKPSGSKSKNPYEDSSGSSSSSEESEEEDLTEGSESETETESETEEEVTDSEDGEGAFSDESVERYDRWDASTQETKRKPLRSKKPKPSGSQSRNDSSDSDQNEEQLNEEDSSSDDDFLSKKKKPRKKSKLLKSESDNDEKKQNKDGAAINDATANDKLDSSSGDEDSECCAICLGKLTSKKLPSKPNSGCGHWFCRECLIEWSKQVNTCPIDRGVFQFIIVYNRIGGHEIAREKIKQKVAEDTPAEVINEDHQERILCETCGCGDRSNVLLLCDGCDLGYHMDCLVPSLGTIPRGRWFCPTCEASGLISDYILQAPRHIGRPIEDPLPRTIENVRIRATIQRTINQVSALVGALSRPTTSRAPRGAAATPRRKRKSTTRKPASGSSAKKRKTSTKRKSVKRKKSTRAPGQPKRNQSSYFLWMNENRPLIKGRFPGLNLSEFAKKAGELWHDMGDKSEWEMKASEDKRRYDAEMEEWIADGGVPKVTKRKTKAKTRRKTSKRKSTSSKTKKKRKSTSPRKGAKRKTSKGKKKKAKTSRKSAKKSEEKGSAAGGSNKGVVISDFHLFGGHDELLFFGDDEDENSLASSSRGAGGTQSRSEAAQIFRQTSREKPVAKVKPMIRDEETPAAEPNLLGDLLKRQNEFLKPADRSTFELKEPAHQKEVSKKPVATSSPFSSSSSSSQTKKTNNPALIKNKVKSASNQVTGRNGEDDAKKRGQQPRPHSASASTGSKCTTSAERPSKRPTSTSSTSTSSNSAKSREAKNEAETTLKKKQQELLSEGKKQGGMHASEDHLKKATDKSLLMLKAEEQVKKYLKPLFFRKLVSKENYKIIMRKCVEKIYNKAKIGCTIHDNNVLKLVQDYVKRYDYH